ncbi:hypothetical protein J6TS1_18730 [Siminovitchia terrae]|uniref:Uncharacterized protein n=1 Tax=Siminovitchia terrae TaxID=1914933 RepID=A0ABQ4KVF4_SIMTE|nr:hypothetical protein J22TS1_46780 [Siminovitchia terrae]GIN96003.1 hypothetical protein J6TS1_18730 [Siminovitchia terrae]
MRASSFILYEIHVIGIKISMFKQKADNMLNNLWFVFFKIRTDTIVEINKENKIII